MLNRYESIATIKGLYGLDFDVVNECLGYKGDSFDDYNDKELDLLAKEQIELDNFYTAMSN